MNRCAPPVTLFVLLMVAFIGIRKCGAEEQPTAEPGKVITNSIGMKLAPIPAVEFLMGSPDSDEEAFDDEKPQHQVKITKPYYMGVYEVTQEEYRKVMGKAPSFFSKRGGGKKLVEGLDTSRFPVEKVMWNQVVEFCDKLSSLPAEKAAGRVYKLPTEAEWEYACRAGTTTTYHLGDSLSSAQANFNGNLPSEGAVKGPFLARTTVVGSYKPNALGLFDMHGNVCEWCADPYNENYYQKSPPADPKGASGHGMVYRGGSWGDDAFGCRSACRESSIKPYRYRTRGFRVVLSR